MLDFSVVTVFNIRAKNAELKRQQAGLLCRKRRLKRRKHLWTISEWTSPTQQIQAGSQPGADSACFEALISDLEPQKGPGCWDKFWKS